MLSTADIARLRIRLSGERNSLINKCQKPASVAIGLEKEYYSKPWVKNITQHTVTLHYHLLFLFGVEGVSCP